MTTTAFITNIKMDAEQVQKIMARLDAVRAAHGEAPTALAMSLYEILEYIQIGFAVAVRDARRKGMDQATATSAADSASGAVAVLISAAESSLPEDQRPHVHAAFSELQAIKMDAIAGQMGEKGAAPAPGESLHGMFRQAFGSGIKPPEA